MCRLMLGLRLLTDDICAGSRAALAHAVAVEAAYAEADAALHASSIAASAVDIRPAATPGAAQSLPQQAATVRSAGSEDSCFSAGSSDAGPSPRAAPQAVATLGREQKTEGAQPATPPTPSPKAPKLAVKTRRWE